MLLHPLAENIADAESPRDVAESQEFPTRLLLKPVRFASNSVNLAPWRRASAGLILSTESRSVEKAVKAGAS